MEMDITFAGNKKVLAHYKGFTVASDQPVKEGGDGSAPEPYDLLLASIGTCAGVYVIYFCEKRHIPIDGLKMTLQSEKNSKTNLFESIRLEIQLPAGFPDKYRSAVVRAAEMCTVKRSFKHPPQIEVVAEPRS